VQKFSSGGAFLLSWGSMGTGDGQFELPRGIAVGPNGHVYVADWNLDRVYEFTDAGVLVRTIGQFGYGLGDLGGPSGVVVAPLGDLFVSEDLNHRIQHFDSSGNPIALIDLDTIVPRGTGPTQPFGIALSPGGHLLVTDYSNHRVIELTGDGQFVQVWGSLGAGAGQMNYPLGIAIGADGGIYVADHMNARIDKFGALPTPATHSSWGKLKKHYR